MTNTNDTGPGSLRQAILDSNAQAGTQTIAFQIAGAGVQSIVPVTILPSLNDPVVIDGYTQPGSSPNTLAEGTNAVLLVELVGPGANGSGLQLRGGNSLVRGLVINRFFNAPAVNISAGNNNRVEGCFLGTDAAGTAKFTDQSREGVSISNSTGNTVGGTTPDKRNLISGHRLNGVNIFGAGAGANVVQGNLIGTDKTGTAALGNGQVGVSISGFTDNLIGGATAAARNVISANNTGIAIFTGANTVQGNYIGTDVTGAVDLGNNGTGLFMQGAANNLVGGLTATPGQPPGNVISGNGSSGIDINGNAAPGHAIQGNLVGTNAAGTAAIPNAGDGISIRNTGGGNLVGDAGAQGRNVVSGNSQHGITLNNNDNRLLGNYVGVGADGATALGNARNGVLINSRDNNALTANRIAFNGEDGVAVNFFNTGTGNALRSNSIFSNTNLGIDLGAGGVTANDTGDADVGANGLQNFPVLTSAAAAAGSTAVAGTLNSAPNATFTVQFFSGPACDASGHGEGQVFLGETLVTTDGAGNASVNVVLPTSVASGHAVTATATSAANNTSEFSPCAFATSLASPGISGQVTDDGRPLAGITITLSGSQTRVAQTDAGGNYSFLELAAGGDYTVAASSPYYAFGARRDFPNFNGNQVANFPALSGPPDGAPLTSDDFGGAARDAAKWNLGTLTQPPGAFDPLVTVRQQDGRLVITPRSNVSGPHYNGYVSVTSIDFTNGQASVEVPQVAANGAETIFALGSDFDNYFRFVAGSPSSPAIADALKASAATEGLARGLTSSSLVLVFQVKVAGVVSQQVIPYDPVQHRFWRFRHDAPANAIVFETSPDNQAFTERYRKSLEKGVAALACELSAGTSVPVADPGQAVFDNFSLVTATAQFAASSFAGGEGSGQVTITVTRAGNVAAAASLTYVTIDDPAAVPCDPTLKKPDGSAFPAGTAYARCDYASAIDTLSFAPGETQKTFTVPLIDDAFVEGDETFRLVLRGTSGAALGAPGQVIVTIADNDSAGQPNPISGNSFFVRQQYLDFLSREPEAGEPWTGVLARCPDVNNTDPNSPSAGCDRILVSQSFFQSPEFQLKGLYTFLFYRVAFNRRPAYEEIIPDMRGLAGATPQEVFDRRAAYATAITRRPEFTALYGGTSNQQYVEAMLGRYNLQQITTEDPQDFEGAAQVTLTKQQLIDALNHDALTRAQVLRAVVQSSEVDAAEYHGAFVSMQYYGYLRRTPEDGGYQAWLRVIKQDPNNVRVMVDGFMNSQEYRLRFGPP